MTSAVLRADASHAAGSGHVRRCLPLAQALRDRGWDINRATIGASAEIVPELAKLDLPILPMSGDPTHEPADLGRARPDGADLLVVDHYGRNAAFEAACRPWARHIAVIDDVPSRRHDADVLIDMTLGRTPDNYNGLLPDHTTCLTGTHYALLRPAFAAARHASLTQRWQRTGIARILVTVGAIDQSGAIPHVLHGIDAAGFQGTVEIVGNDVAPADGHAYQVVVTEHGTDMAAAMAVADIAIGACGVTSWERCCLGLPTIAIITATNQHDIADALAAAGAILLVDPVEPAAIATALARLQDHETLHRMSAIAAAVCDGLGARHAATALADLIQASHPTRVRLT